jgi:FHA domain-containing protein/zinc ribbon protein
MTAVCPAGHTSASEDYCDVCGMPIDKSVQAPATPPPSTDPPTQAPAGQTCPNCSTVNLPDALFCENCGYDFTTQSMPRPLAPPQATGPNGAVTPQGQAGPEETFDWVAEVWIDPAWYQAQESPDPLPSPGLPEVIPLRGSSLLVGRTSNSRNIHPEIDCESDAGVSRRQAQLTTDGRRWWVEDLESANGTFVGPASGALPEDPIPVGIKRELAVDDRVYVGAWTRLVIRPATDEERNTLG